jgi:chromate transporter
VEALWRIGRRALTFRLAPWFALTAFVAIYAFSIPFPIIILAAGALGYFMRSATPAEAHVLAHDGGVRANLRLAAAAILAWVVPVLAVIVLAGIDSTLARIGLFYSVVAMVTFGGAYAVLGYVAERAAGDWGWLDAKQMADGLGLAETTPGPLILVLQFVAFIAAFRTGGSAHPYGLAIVASVLASWVLFVPSFVWIFLGGPHLERINADPRLRGALSCVTAAVVGVVLNLTVWFAVHVVFAEVHRVKAGPLSLLWPAVSTLDVRALGLVILSAVLMFGLGQGIVRTIGICAVAGLLVGYL